MPNGYCIGKHGPRLESRYKPKCYRILGKTVENFWTTADNHSQAIILNMFGKMIIQNFSIPEEETEYEVCGWKGGYNI